MTEPSESQAVLQAIAEEQMLEAVQSFLRVRGDLEPGGLVTTFVLSAHMESVEMADRGASSYAYYFSHGQAPHIHEGLMLRALRWLINESH